jgi:hypothetical protein
MSADRYTGLADCPCCFESCGYLGDHSRGYDGAECFTPSNRPCPECNGTGKVECEPRTLDDLESEEWSADFAAWFASIVALALPPPETGISIGEKQ